MCPPKKALIMSHCWAHVCWDIRYSPICLPKLFPWRLLLFLGVSGVLNTSSPSPWKGRREPQHLNQDISNPYTWTRHLESTANIEFVVICCYENEDLQQSRYKIRYNLHSTAPISENSIRISHWNILKPPCRKLQLKNIQCQGSSCQISSAQRDLAVASKSVLQMPAPRWRYINHRSIIESRAATTPSYIALRK